jgi:PAS domain S-box-containing protein
MLSRQPFSLLDGLGEVLAHACEQARVPAGLILWEEGGFLHPILHHGLADSAVPAAPVPTEAGHIPEDLLRFLRQSFPEWAAWPLHWQGQQIGWFLLGGPEPTREAASGPAERARYVGLMSLLLVGWGEVVRREERLRAAEEEARQRALVQRISTLVNSTLDLDETLRVAVREMAQAFHVDHSAVILLDAEKQSAQLVAEYPERGLLGHRFPMQSLSPHEKDLAAGRPVVITRTSGDLPPGVAHCLVDELGLCSMLLLPLKVDTAVLGSIGLDAFTTPRIFSSEEIAVAQTVANQVAAAIARVRLFQEKATSEDYFRRVVEQAHDLIYTLDREGRFIFVNQIAEEVTGYRLSDLLGERFDQIVIPEDRPLLGVVMDETLAGRGQALEVRIYDVVGKIHHLEVNTAPLQSGDEVIGIIGFSRDITGSKEAEEALLQRTRQAEKRAALLRAIGEVSRKILTLLNPLSLLQSTVDSLVKNLGYDFAHVLLIEGDSLAIRASAGKSGQAPVGSSFPVEQGITGQAARTGQPYLSNDAQQDVHYYHCSEELSQTQSELALPIRNSTEVCGVLDVQSVARSAFDEADLLALSSLADQLGIALENAQLLERLHQRMAELEQTRARLSQAEKLSALGELIANAAHELNNPLTSVIGYAQLVQAAVQDPVVLRDLGTIIQSAQRAARIVEDLLIFARERVPLLEQVAVDNLLQQAVTLRFSHLAEEHIAVDLLLVPDLPPVRADPGQLEQVFTNLIQNARQAIIEGPGQGRITLRTSWVEASPRDGKWVRIEVSDDGPGIAQEALLRIFDPFFTTRENLGATGMGLSICYGIVVRHGGLIWAESELGQGARFFVELPAGQDETSWDEVNRSP